MSEKWWRSGLRQACSDGLIGLVADCEGHHLDSACGAAGSVGTAEVRAIEEPGSEMYRQCHAASVSALDPTTKQQSGSRQARRATEGSCRPFSRRPLAAEETANRRANY